MTESTTCPKCSEPMVRGYVMDHAHASLLIPHWVEGVPMKGWFGNVKMPYRMPKNPLGAFRCEGCGFLEFYARAEFAPS